MSKREVIAWYVILGLVAFGTGTMCWWLAEQNRFLDAACVMFMGASTIWMCASNLDDDFSPPTDSGNGMDSE